MILKHKFCKPAPSRLAQHLRAIETMTLRLLPSRRKTSILYPLFALLFLVLIPAVAQAQFGLRVVRLKRLDTNEELTGETLNEFFNTANCECGSEIKIEVELSGKDPTSTENLQVVAGKNCINSSNPKLIEEQCVSLFGPTLIGDIEQDFDITTNARAMMQDSCAAVDRQSYALSFLVEDNSSGEWRELNISSTNANKIEYNVDTVAPDPPKEPQVAAGEGQVTISFKSHTDEVVTLTDGGTADGSSSTTTSDTNFLGYQVLCETASGASALDSPKKAEFEATANMCGTSCESGGLLINGGGGSQLDDGGVPDALLSDSSIPDTTVDMMDISPDAAVPDATADSAAADAAAVEDASADGPTAVSEDSRLCEKFVCSGLTTSPGSITVTGLRNGETYNFYIVTIDKSRNPSTPVSAGEGTPQLVEDLWERYKRKGGKAEGGHCFVATAAYGSYDHPHVRILRQFRDDVLLPTASGRRFVSQYYHASPPLADWLSEHPTARGMARTALWPVTLAVGAYLYTAIWQKGLFLVALGLFSLGLWRRSRSRKQSHGG
jgi:hypothetical protein